MEEKKVYTPATPEELKKFNIQEEKDSKVFILGDDQRDPMINLSLKNDPEVSLWVAIEYHDDHEDVYGRIKDFIRAEYSLPFDKESLEPIFSTPILSIPNLNAPKYTYLNSIGFEDFEEYVRGIKSAVLIRELMDKLDPDKYEVLAKYIDNEGEAYILYNGVINENKLKTSSDILSDFEDHYMGQYDSLTDYFYDFMVESGVYKALSELNMERYTYKLAQIRADEESSDKGSGEINAVKMNNGKYAIFLTV